MTFAVLRFFMKNWDKTKNKYFDVDLKISKFESATVCVMDKWKSINVSHKNTVTHIKNFGDWSTISQISLLEKINIHFKSILKLWNHKIYGPKQEMKWARNTELITTCLEVTLHDRRAKLIKHHISVKDIIEITQSLRMANR